ncbi:MAG: diaminopimelate epimerase [Wolinella sp.]
MKIPVSKYSASGNDFLIFHAFKKGDRSALAKQICDSHQGLGADGLIVLLPHSELDFEWEFYNRDGSRANMCGNGARAAALHAFTHALAGDTQRFLTGAGIISASIQNHEVEVALTAPKILDKGIERLGFSWWFIDTGVPHLVSLDKGAFALPKSELECLRHEFDANVNVAQNRAQGIALRTFERGVEDETLACGTGMAAVFLRAHHAGIVPAQAVLIPASGEHLELRIAEEEIFFKGKVSEICDTFLNFGGDPAHCADSPHF